MNDAQGNGVVAGWRMPVGVGLIAALLCAAQAACCFDRDGDGYGRGNCAGPDCDDGDASVHPNASEVPGNGVDDDCSASTSDGATVGRPRLALLLPQKGELLAEPDAHYDLLLGGFFEYHEAESIRANAPRPTALYAGLTHTWVYNEADWKQLLVSVANGGDPNGPLQLSDDMYLGRDLDGDGVIDEHCGVPGWGDEIWAMDPRHEGWRELITAFYRTAGGLGQHDGVFIDMVDAYPFCRGDVSGGVPEPMDDRAWVMAQAELLALIRQQLAPGRSMMANAGRDFDVDVAAHFAPLLDGYVLENFLGEWGLATVEKGLASAERALALTRPPHTVVFAADSGGGSEIPWPRFRTALVASMLMDNTYLAFDIGPRAHGGVIDWWFPEYYDVDLGVALGPYAFDEDERAFRRDFQHGTLLAASASAVAIDFSEPHSTVPDGEVGTTFVVQGGDAGIFRRVGD